VRRSAIVGLLALAFATGVARGEPTKGEGPTTIAAGYGSVWVGTGNGTLVRVDARLRQITHRLLRESPAQYGFVHGLAVGFGSVWIAQGRYDTLKRVDPQTNRSVDVRPRGPWTATLVAAGAGAVWVGDFDRDAVFRIEPRTNRVSARVPVPGRLWGLVAGPAGVWIVALAGDRVTPETRREVRRLDARTNRIGPPLLTSRCDVALAVGSRRLWASDLCARTVTTVGNRIGPPVRVGEAAVSLVVGAGAVWVLSQADRTVSRLDPGTGRILATIPVRGTWLASGARAVWVLDLGDGRVGFVRRIDPRTNRVVGRPIRIEPR
jgi:DNA-binding beta-propeller fold protein YncE